METELFEAQQTATYISPVNALSLFKTDKAQRKTFCEGVVNQLKDEQADPLEVQVYIKAMEEIINTLTCTDEKKNKTPWLAKEYKDMLLAAAEKQGKKFMLHNAEFSIKEVGSVPDFSKCDDPELPGLLLEQEEIKAKVEARKTFLKALPFSGVEVVDKNTGDMVTIYPPSKSSTTSVSVSLK